jgi:hypothetical protein
MELRTAMKLVSIAVVLALPARPAQTIFKTAMRLELIVEGHGVVPVPHVLMESRTALRQVCGSFLSVFLETLM